MSILPSNMAEGALVIGFTIALLVIIGNYAYDLMFALSVIGSFTVCRMFFSWVFSRFL